MKLCNAPEAQNMSLIIMMIPATGVDDPGNVASVLTGCIVDIVIAVDSKVGARVNRSSVVVAFSNAERSKNVHNSRNIF